MAFEPIRRGARESVSQNTVKMVQVTNTTKIEDLLTRMAQVEADIVDHERRITAMEPQVNTSTSEVIAVSDSATLLMAPP